MGKQDNPFKVLGLDRDVVRSLTDEQAARLVEQQYRFLQKVFHPDVGGDPRKSRALNEARSALDIERDPESFARLKLAYTRRGAATAERTALKIQSGVTEDRRDRLLAGMFGYLRCRLQPDDKPSIFTPGPLALHLHDLLLARTMPPGYRRDSNDPAFFQLCVERKGGLTIRRPGRPAAPYTGHVLVGTVPAAVKHIGPTNPLNTLLNQLVPDRNPVPSRHRSLTSARHVSAGTVAQSRQIPPDAIKPLAEFMTPHFTQSGFLFTAGTAANGLYFTLEGTIVSTDAD